MRKLIVILMVAGLAASAQANLLVNGGFSTDPTAAGGGWTLISGSTTSNVNYRWSDTPGSESSGNPAPGVKLATTGSKDSNGNWIKDSWVRGILAQTIAVTPNTDYDYGFDADFWGTASQGNVIVSRMEVWTTGTGAAKIADAIRAGGNGWVTTSGSFNSGSSTEVAVKLISTNRPWEPEAYFDNAYVVPEPATMVLLGLGSLAMLRRRKLKVKN